MRILLTGGTGFIGEALVPALWERGAELVLLSRRPRPGRTGLRYVRSLAEIAPDTSLDAVINLAGASLAAKRWSEAYKREIRASRIDGTRALVEWLARLESPPRVLLSASAVGFYGHQRDTLLDEDSPAVPGFAQALCADWEALAEQAADLGTRTCCMRLGVVLAAGGGAYREMARSFRLGVGSWIGDGEQWLSWIHREDAVAAMLYLLDHPVLSGPFNLTAPEPITARGFAEALSRYYRTLFNLPLPAPVARVLLGEMADELLLNGQRVLPSRLQAAGFDFRYPGIDAALAQIRAR